MIKKLLSIFIFFIPFILLSQDKQALNWITNNLIEIEDANPDTELVYFKENTPNKFANAKIFGFGEASHNTKEFFDIKAKFFKYLVKVHGVKVFIMEESYQAEYGINEWISGGKGDVKTIAENFSNGFWYTKEIVNLLQWMRNYNLGKPKEEHIRFYGMDIQIGRNINKELREFINRNNISIDNGLLTVADSCASREIDFSVKDSWWQAQTPKLMELKQQLLDCKTEGIEYRHILRSLDYLINYTEYASLVKEEYPKSTEFRDLKMFENVKYIIENESENAKAFIWAHNTHINKKEMYYSGSNIINLGRHLKNLYGDDYYSLGFDFGTGIIKGLVLDKKKGNYWKTYHIKKPFNNTYAKTLTSVDKDIYFVDLNTPIPFFNKKSKHLLIAGGGYQPKPLHKILVSKIYAETYDGLIFVKKISVPDYNLN